MRTKRAVMFIACLMLSAGRAIHANPEPAGQPIIHEWGTFTSFQDEQGRAFGYINAADEELPDFVHNAAPSLHSRSALRSKGLPQCHPDITMRLETPVLYFHLPEGVPRPVRLDVKVGFRGGWLTQFYPNAQAELPGLGGKSALGPISGATFGTLEWRGLSVGGTQPGPETTSHVWLAPREVKAESVVTSEGEAEKYLFYRGVGHLDSPLRVSRSPAAGGELLIRGAIPSAFPAASPMSVQRIWLVDIRPSGEVAWRRLYPITLEPGEEGNLATTPAEFTEEEFTEAYDEEAQASGLNGNLARLRGDMLEALVEDGLYEDEAAALLATWELSYFRSWGLRLFFIVPKPWTEHYLPLEVSIPARVERVMMGRIEIVRPAQRALVRGLAASLVARPTDAKPEDARIFDAICLEQLESASRFARVLLMEEYLKHPSPRLERFVRMCGLSPASGPNPAAGPGSPKPAR